MAEQLTRGEIQDLLTKFSKSNPNYRDALLKNPKLVLEGQMGGKLPDGFFVKAVEETPNTIYVVVPYVPRAGAELSDDELESVAGGLSKGPAGGSFGKSAGQLLGGGAAGGGGGHSGGDTYSCSNSHGGQNTRVEFNSAVTLK